MTFSASSTVNAFSVVVLIFPKLACFISKANAASSFVKAYDEVGKRLGEKGLSVAPVEKAGKSD